MEGGSDMSCVTGAGDNEHIDKSSRLIYQNPIISYSRLFYLVCPGSGEDEVFVSILNMAVVLERKKS